MAHRTHSRDAVATDPHIGPILPLLYVAWADGELTEDEVRAIRGTLPQRFLDSPGAERFLDTWLHPESPPTTAEMQALLQEVRAANRRLGARATEAQAQKASDPAGTAGAFPPETAEALRKIERIVGLGRGEAVGVLSAPDTSPGEDAPAQRPDIRPLQAFLDGPHSALRQRIRDLLSRKEFALRHEVHRDEHRELVFAWCQRLAASGLGSLAFPVAYGGRGDPRASTVAFEMLAFHDTSLLIKYGVQFGLFGGAVNMLGTQRHHEKYLRQIASLQLPGCYAMTELAHGSNVAGLQTTATFDRATDSFIVETPSEGARKEYIGNAACHARMAAVFAQLVVDGETEGVHALLVPIRDETGTPLPGVRIGDSGPKMGLNGVDNGRLWFDRVRVPRENLLNRYADVDRHGRYTSPIASPSKRFFTMLGALVVGRLSIALASLSTAKAGLAIAIRYGHQRRQFGAPGARETRLLDYLTHQRRLLPHVATAYALDCALKWELERYAENTGEPSREIESTIAGLKAYASWYALRALQESRECCGGQGYLSVNRLGALRADTEIFVTFEGDNTVLMQLVAKGLLSDYRRQFGDMRAFTVVKHLAARAEMAVSEHNPITTRMTGRSHLRDPKFHRAAFALREQHLVSSAARRLRRRIANGMSSHDAFHECQDHLVTLAAAHVERVVAERFHEAVEGADEAARPLLRTLRDLFALSRLEADRGWFLECGYFAPAKSKAIRNEVNALCGEVRPDAVALVDAFGIPEALLPDMPTGG